jgi:hypothetical protein
MNPPTWAKNATPPPVRRGAEQPEARLDELVQNHSPRKIQAGILTRKIGKIHVRIRDPRYRTK